MQRWAASALVAVAMVAAATGCTSGEDKAGGGDGEPPLVLRLETEDLPQLTGSPEFAEAVARLSGGAMRIEIAMAGRGTQIDYERGVVADVRGGRAQLGIVAIRVWDTLGVKTFRALLAPFLVDTPELQTRVLASTLPDRMLEGVERAGVVGIAVLPGPLRQPFGVSRAFVDPDDYRGATMGTRPARIARETFRALGARPRSNTSGNLTGLDGIEIDPATLRYNGFDEQRGWLTTNVVLWPRPYSIVMNRRAFAALTSSQQELLRRAGREAAVLEQRQVTRDAATALRRACTRGKLTFVEASPRQLAELRTAVRAVYAALERDPVTWPMLTEIVAMRAGGSQLSTELRSCRVATAKAASSSPLLGTWKLTRVSKQELIDAGTDSKNAEALSRLPGTPVLEFLPGGRHRGLDLETGRVLSTGTYEVDGDLVRLVFESGVAVDLRRVYTLRWSRYRGLLTFTAVPGSEPLTLFVLSPWKRVR